jgi:hypothetical protein
MAQDLKVRQMKMQGMVHIGPKLPYFGGTEFWTDVHPLRIEWFSVDGLTLRRSRFAAKPGRSSDWVRARVSNFSRLRR